MHTWNKIVQASSNFDPYFSLTKAMVLEVKKWDPKRVFERHLRAFVKLALIYASATTDKHHAQLIQLLNCLERILSALFRQGNFDWKHLNSGQSKTHRLLLPWAIKLDLHFWVQHLLENGQPAEPREGCKSYLSFALDCGAFLEEDLKIPKDSIPSKHFESSNRNPIPNRCLRLLLSYGASPYWRQDEEPLWKYICSEMSKCCWEFIHGESDKFNCLMDAAIIFMEYGADVSSMCRFIPNSVLHELRTLRGTSTRGTSIKRFMGLLNTDTCIHESSRALNSPRLLRLSKVRKSYRRKRERQKLASQAYAFTKNKRGARNNYLET